MRGAAQDGLHTARYVLLTTSRRDGSAVPTPFGALHLDGKIYCYTMARSGKVKRIRREPRVDVAPCTQRGAPTGPAVSAHARVLTGAEGERIATAFDALWTRQFGPLWWVSSRIERLRGLRRAVIEIVPEGV